MAKKKDMSVPTHCEGPSKQLLEKEAAERYQRDYGFQEAIPPQSPVDRYDYHYIKERAEGEHPYNSYMPVYTKAETALVLGKPDTMRGRRTGNIYAKTTSKGGHRIGSRKK